MHVTGNSYWKIVSDIGKLKRKRRTLKSTFITKLFKTKLVDREFIGFLMVPYCAPLIAGLCSIVMNYIQQAPIQTNE